MGVSIRHAGSIKELQACSVRQGGSIKAVQEIWVRRAGVISKVWPVGGVLVANFYEITRFVFDGPVSGSITFNSDGTVSGDVTANPPWFCVPASGIGASYFIRWRTVSNEQSIGVNTSTGFAEDSFVSLGSNRTLTFTSPSTRNGQFAVDISPDLNPANAVTSTIFVSLETGQ